MTEPQNIEEILEKVKKLGDELPAKLKKLQRIRFGGLLGVLPMIASIVYDYDLLYDFVLLWWVTFLFWESIEARDTGKALGWYMGALGVFVIIADSFEKKELEHEK